MKKTERKNYPTLNRILKEKGIDFLVPGNKPLRINQATAIRNLIAPELTLDELFELSNLENVDMESEVDKINEMLSSLNPEQLAYIRALIHELYFKN